MYTEETLKLVSDMYGLEILQKIIFGRAALSCTKVRTRNMISDHPKHISFSKMVAKKHNLDARIIDIGVELSHYEDMKGLTGLGGSDAGITLARVYALIEALEKE